MSRLIIIDRGHGYDTVGKSAVMPSGEVFEEWEFNEIIKNRLISKLYRLSIPFHDLVPNKRDIPLSDRIITERSLTKKNNKRLLLSIHGDAFTNTEANGITVFTSKGITVSDKYGDVLVEELSNLGMANRFDYDSEGFKGREADFYILKNSVSPSVLVELGFYTNESDVKKMFDSSFQEQIADCLASACVKFQMM